MLTADEQISYWPTASSTVARTCIDPVTAEMVNVLSLDATDSIMHWYSPYNNTIIIYFAPHSTYNAFAMALIHTKQDSTNNCP